MGMFFYNINYNGNPKKPVLPSGAKLNYYNQTTLPYDSIDCSKIADVDGMRYMFLQSSYQTLPPLLSTADKRIWAECFYNCAGLITAPDMDTSGGYAFADMFNGCSHLVTIPRLNISGNSGTPENLYRIFQGCTRLETIGWDGDIKASLNMEDCAALSDATILATCYALYDGAGQTLTLNTALSAKGAQNIKLNATADGLEFCDAADPDTIGTLNDYVTAKSWTLQFS